MLGRTFIFLHARLGLYALLTAGCFAAVAATYLIWPNDAAEQIALALFPPVVAAAAYAFTGYDAGLQFDARARALQRLVLVMAVDYISGSVVGVAFAAGGAGEAAACILLLTAAITLTYADVYVVFEDAVDGFLFLRSFGRSAAVAWGGLESIGRTIAIFALQLLPLAIAHEVELRFKASHLMYASFWPDAVLGIISLPVVSVLAALTYLDATGNETKLTCGK